MKLKDTFIGLVIFELAIGLYYAYSTVKYLWRELSNFGFDQFYQFSSVLKQFFSLGFTFIGVAGLIIFFSNKDIYNRFLKFYLIHHTLSILIYLPNRLIWIFNPPGETGMPWFYHFFYLIAIITSVVAIIFYSKQKIRTLPAPVSNKGVRFAHYVIDTIYVNITMLSASSIFFGYFKLFDDHMLNTVFGYAYLLIMPLVYYFVCEAGFKQTLGKVVTGAYVRSSKATQAGIPNLLGRSLCRYIPFEAFSYLPDPMAKWHDKLSGTDVFYKSNVDFQAHEDDGLMDHLVSDGDWFEEK